jgi:hypothetical protein
LDQTIYHVLLEGRTVGPYDRRTIVGMRIKNALTGEDVLIGTNGARLTVADLIGRAPVAQFNPDRSGSFSVVQATYTAGLVDRQGRGIEIPEFKGEVEVRVQGEVLRLAGRYRHGLRWKEGRVKIVLKDVVHARVNGSQTELWLRNGASDRLQRVTLELFTHEAAGELAEWLPGATPFPKPVAAGSARAPAGSSAHGLWIALAAGVVVVGLMLGVLLLRRLF